MRRVVIGLVAGLALAIAATQLALPPYLEGRVEDRLTERGGRAEVDLDAVPAVRLLAHHGRRFRLDGDGLRLDPSGDAIEDLDGFDEVDVRLTATRVGPIDADRISLTRAGERSAYRVRAAGTTSGRALSAYAGSQVGGGLGALAGELAAGAVPLSDRPIPVSLDSELRSEDGRLRAVSSELSVAGLSAGPLATLIVGAVAASL
jgi:hypothetical protein